MVGDADHPLACRTTLVERWHPRVTPCAWIVPARTGVPGHPSPDTARRLWASANKCECDSVAALTCSVRSATYTHHLATYSRASASNISMRPTLSHGARH